LTSVPLRMVGAYKSLKLWEDRTNWGRFFVFRKDFVDFNRSGMRAEDPNAHKWRESKVWINYTEHVSSDDWANAFNERHLCEVAEIKDQLREGVPRDEIMRVAPEDMCGPQSRMWDWYAQTHGNREASAALHAARAKLTGSLLKQKLSFSEAFGASSKVQETKYSQYAFKSRLMTYNMPLFLWAGGTYARREADFPEAQSTATWLENRMVPLGIRSPGVHFCRSIEEVIRTWKQAQWYSKAPHRSALLQPFPFAIASMQDFWLKGT